LDQGTLGHLYHQFVPYFSYYFVKHSYTILIKQEYHRLFKEKIKMEVIDMQDKEKITKDKVTAEIPSNTPLNMTYSVRTDLNSENPFNTTSYYAGDSVDEHKDLEEANDYFNEKELGQENENL
jgi:hypothetical protein